MDAKDRIKIARAIAKVSQQDCEKYGIPAATIKQWENKKEITYKASVRLEKMFSQLGYSFSSSWFLTGKGSSPLDLGAIRIYDDSEYIKNKYPDLKTLVYTSSVNVFGIIEPSDLVICYETTQSFKDFGDSVFLVKTKEHIYSFVTNHDGNILKVANNKLNSCLYYDDVVTKYKILWIGKG